MFTRLIESRRVRERGVGARLASVGLHAVVLGAAVFATGFSTPAPVEITIFDTLPVYVAPMPLHGTSHATGHSCGGGLCVPRNPLPPIDVTIIDDPPGLPTELPGEIFGPGGAPGGTVSGGDDTGSSDGIYEIVERPAAALAGNPRPAYPALLRSARIEGTVSARFVVDTTGRVEPASLTFESAGERLFEASVRRALDASRFSPAETQGHRVRMLVRQDFAFRLTP